MLDLIKKTMLAGIGATVTTKEKVEGFLNEYVEKGKISAQDAKSLSERIIADGKQEFETAKHDLGQRFQEMLEKSKVATRDELHALEKRLAALEGKHSGHTAEHHHEAHKETHHAETKKHSAKH